MKGLGLIELAVTTETETVQVFRSNYAARRIARVALVEPTVPFLNLIATELK